MASPNVSFEQIPGSTRTPGVYVEFNARLAVRSLPANRQRLRLVGQRRTSGTVAALVPTQLFSDADAAAYFGAGSQLHLMARAALKANPYVDLHAIALDDAGASTAASGTITIAGTATSSGRLIARIGAVDVACVITTGDAAAAVATALNAALAAVPDLAVTAAVAGAVVTLTARNKGAAGNDIKVAARWDTAAGLTATVVAMAGGTGNPDIAAALAVLQPAGDQLLVMPYTDTANLTKLRTHLQFTGNGLEMRGAVGVVGTAASYGTAVATAVAINDGRMVEGLCPDSGSLPWEIGAALAAVLAFEEDPARPLNGLELVGIDPAPLASRLTKVQVEGCLANGVTPLGVGPGEHVQIVRAVSTYTTNAAGVTDVAWLDITTVRTLDYVRTALRTRLALRFPREKATQRVLKSIRSEVIDVLLRLEELEIVENVRANLARIVVELDSQEVGRVNVRIPADVVNGLHVIAAVVDLYL